MVGWVSSSVVERPERGLGAQDRWCGFWENCGWTSKRSPTFAAVARYWNGTQRPATVCATGGNSLAVNASVRVTVRLGREFDRLYEQSPKHRDGLVFGIRDDVKHSFDTVRRAAGLSDVRFHDLRHTAATRLVGLHIPLSEVGRVLGHTQANTTYRYVNANIETARRASAALDAFNANAESQPVTELVN